MYVCVCVCIQSSTHSLLTYIFTSTSYSPASTSTPFIPHSLCLPLFLASQTLPPVLSLSKTHIHISVSSSFMCVPLYLIFPSLYTPTTHHHPSSSPSQPLPQDTQLAPESFSLLINYQARHSLTFSISGINRSNIITCITHQHPPRGRVTEAQFFLVQMRVLIINTVTA